ncbi:MAG: aspartate kinase [Lachnospiraceae bacterium]
MLIVKKFGGTSVADKGKIMRAANRCAAEWQKGNDVICVLSAMGAATDDLIALAKDMNPEGSKREMDMLLSTGEQVSVSLMAMALQSLKIPAVSLNAFQVRMHGTSHYSDARFKGIDTERIHMELENRKVVVVTGFQAINKRDDFVTLGRGGSDTTAVALAASLKADQCEIYTDVDGIYTADPRIVENARKLSEITYDEMLELATLGAKVLHNRSVEMAKKYGVELVVRSSMKTEEGTVVKEAARMENMIITGAAADKNTARISVIGLQDRPGIAFKLFNLLSHKHINIDNILQSVGRENTKDITFTLARDDLKEALKVLEEKRDSLTIQEISHDDKVAKVSVVGAGMMSNPGIASKMFEALSDVGINIDMISTSEIRISVLVKEKDADRALVAVHDAFLDRY